MTPTERNRALRADEINFIRQDLDKRTPAEVEKAERGARKAVDRGARDEGEKGSFLSQIFGGSK